MTRVQKMASSDSNLEQADNSYYTEEVMELFVSDSEAKEFSGFSHIDENNNADPAKILNVNKKSDRTNTFEGPCKGPGKKKKGKAPTKHKNKPPNDEDISKKKSIGKMIWIDKMNSETYIICWKGF